jgi:hypothetical protein
MTFNVSKLQAFSVSDTDAQAGSVNEASSHVQVYRELMLESTHSSMRTRTSRECRMRTRTSRECQHTHTHIMYVCIIRIHTYNIYIHLHIRTHIHTHSLTHTHKHTHIVSFSTISGLFPALCVALLYLSLILIIYVQK